MTDKLFLVKAHQYMICDKPTKFYYFHEKEAKEITPEELSHLISLMRIEVKWFDKWDKIFDYKDAKNLLKKLENFIYLSNQ